MSRKKILFSVVIAAFNEERHVSACLKSVFAQSLPKDEYEVVLVDNNSTDKTYEIAQNYPVKLVKEKRQGYTYALIKGVSESSGEILVFVDADTKVPENWLENYKKDFEDSNVVVSGGAGRFLPKTLFSQVAEIVLYLSGRYLKLFASFNLAVRKSAYDQVGGINQRINYNVDTDLIRRVRKTGKAVFNPQNTVITSSRKYRGLGGAAYSLKGIVNVLFLYTFGKVVFYDFGNVRD